MRHLNIVRAKKPFPYSPSPNPNKKFIHKNIFIEINVLITSLLLLRLRLYFLSRFLSLERDLDREWCRLELLGDLDDSMLYFFL